MSVEQRGRVVLKDRGSAENVDWSAIYADQLPRVYNYFRFRLGPQIDIEELTSRTFEKAWRARSTYNSNLAAFSTWLLKIAQNVAVDYLRSKRYHLPLDAALDVAAPGTPYQDAERDSDLAKLAQLAATLTERERELIALKYGSAISNRLIAKLTGVSESNVGVILHRAVRALRRKW